MHVYLIEKIFPFLCLQCETTKIYCVCDVSLTLDPDMTSILKTFMLQHHFESAVHAVSLALLNSCLVEGCKNQFDEFLEGDKI